MATAIYYSPPGHPGSYPKSSVDLGATVHAVKSMSGTTLLAFTECAVWFVEVVADDELKATRLHDVGARQAEA